MSDWASVIAFVPKADKKGINKHTGRPYRDVTHAFLPEARKFLEAADTGEGRRDLHRFDNTKPMAARAREVLGILERYRGQRRKVLCVAFFAHGYKSGIQAGFRSQRGHTVDDLAEAIAAITGRGPIVPLYCCSTAASPNQGAPGGDGGFADLLRDSLSFHGATRARVDAHTTVKHTTRNPDVRRFQGDGTAAPLTGGQWIVEPGSDLFPAWRRYLRGAGRWHFPWLETAAIRRRLAPPSR